MKGAWERPSGLFAPSSALTLRAIGFADVRSGFQPPQSGSPLRGVRNGGVFQYSRQLRRVPYAKVFFCRRCAASGVSVIPGHANKLDSGFHLRWPRNDENTGRRAASKKPPSFRTPRCGDRTAKAEPVPDLIRECRSEHSRSGFQQRSWSWPERASRGCGE